MHSRACGVTGKHNKGMRDAGSTLPAALAVRPRHARPAPAFPAYLALLATGELAHRAAAAREELRSCTLCPWHCRADRLAGDRAAEEVPAGRSARGTLGVCRTGELAVVAACHPHHGEESVLRGTRGSGTIFFCWCNLRCVFCQNYEISQLGQGRAVTPEELAEMMLRLQRLGCHNVNLVTPSHVIPQLLQAVAVAAERGLRLPLVYNTGGYDDPRALGFLDGVVDIYMPDVKYADPEVARRLSRAPDYPEWNRAAVREMHRQVGDLVVGEDGLARRGLLVRHLVLPEGLAGTAEAARFLAEEISPDTYVNIMDQYYPAYRALRHPPLHRRPTRREVEEAYAAARAAGLWRFHEE